MRHLEVWLFGLCLVGTPAWATTRYVRSSGSTPTAPYTSWATAAADIQTAVNACSGGDLVWVTNGTYTVASGSNVVLITSGITLRSVNGPSVTTIDAGNVAGIRRGLLMTAAAAGALVDGFSIVRGRADANRGGGAKVEAGTLQNCVVSNNWCSNNGWGGGVYVNGGVVTNCTITKNGAWVYAGGVQIDNGTVRNCLIYNNSCGSNTAYGGGGAYLTSAGATLEYCTLRDNRSGVTADGGGVLLVNGTVQNCLIWRNTSAYSGGISMSGGTLQNCTIVGNRNIASPTAAGLRQSGGTARNLVIWGNTPACNFNRDKSGCPDVIKTGGTLTFSCSLPLQAGTGNIALEPAFTDPAAGNFRLLPGSPGIDAGTNLAAVARDLDGTSRPLDGNEAAGAFHDFGCYETAAYNAGTFRGGFSCSTNEGMSSAVVVLRPRPAGTVTNIAWYGWDIDNNGTWEYSGTGSGIVTNTFGIGFHTVTLRLTNSSAAGAACTLASVIRVAAPTVYMRPPGGGAAPAAPYGTWPTAATNLSEALRVTSGGGTVWVTNGTYTITSQVEVVKGVTLKSVNGSAVTLFRRLAGYTRLLLVCSPNALVQGFRLENGLIDSGTQGSVGAGLLLADGIVRSCIITTNNATSNGNGGGIWMTGGRLEQCLVSRNRGWIHGGGIYMSGGVVDRCVIATNTCGFNPAYHGGGIYMSGGIVRNSVIQDNKTGSSGAGGGIYLGGGVVENCTVAHNVCGSGTGGGIYRNAGTVTNTILYFNRRDLSDNNYAGSLSFAAYSCAPELTNGTGNIADDPSFTDAAGRNYRLQPASPCVDTGRNLGTVTNDYDDHARPLDGNGGGGAQHDMGAFERLAATTGPLEVDFTGNQLQGLTSIQVVFTATAVGNDPTPTWYGWDFNNDGTKDLMGAGLGTVTNTFGPGFHTLSLTVSNATLETAVRTRAAYIHVAPLTLYVSPTGGNTEPYTNWAMAANNLPDAVLFALDGTTLRLSNGNYNLAGTLAIGKNITVQGAYGASNTVLRRTGSGNYRVLYLDAPNAVLDSLRITNGYDNSSSFSGIGIYMTKGTVRNCIIEKNTIAGNAHGTIYMLNGLVENSIIRLNVVNLHGGGIYVAGGTVRNCRITHNWAGRWNGGYGSGGVYMSGGVVRNCLLLGNKGGAGFQGGGAYVNGGILESCTVSGNKGGTDGGGVHRNAGTVTNCIIWDNQIESLAIDDAGGTATTYAYSCAPELTSGTGNITGNPKFKVAGSGYGVTLALGDYRLQPDTPCLNTGVFKAWMTGASDLEGNPRFAGSAPDMGAYEIRLSKGVIFTFL